MDLEQRIKSLKEKTFYQSMSIDVIEPSDEFLVITGCINRYRDAEGKVFGDSDSDAVVPYGVDLTRYSVNPIVLYAHNHEDIIGNATNIEVKPEGLFATIKVFKSLNPRVFEAIKLGVLKTFSIGFRLKDLKYDEVNDIFMLTETEMHEISVVSVPANYLSTIDTIEDQDGNKIKGILGVKAEFKEKSLDNDSFTEHLKNIEEKLNTLLSKEDAEELNETKEDEKQTVVTPSLSELAQSTEVSENNFDDLLVVHQTLTDKLNNFLQENM